MALASDAAAAFEAILFDEGVAALDGAFERFVATFAAGFFGATALAPFLAETVGLAAFAGADFAFEAFAAGFAALTDFEAFDAFAGAVGLDFAADLAGFAALAAFFFVADELDLPAEAREGLLATNQAFLGTRRRADEGRSGSRGTRGGDAVGRWRRGCDRLDPGPERLGMDRPAAPCPSGQ
ncbi:MAG: hypothetical protein ACO3ZY_09270, partial [Phycisphaerales bacterium]